MSTHGVRSFRPKIHFTPEKGWANDPNGLCFHEGKYHLFYQNNPGGTSGGPEYPMYWGHAVSADLISWQHLPVALCPDKDGSIFSGSAVWDTENFSGFGTRGKIPLIAMYTRHGRQETQCIACSLDGVNFNKYQKNPVIPNPGLRDFRDPKLFWNPVRKGWSAVIAAGDRVCFYFSRDLQKWEKTGEFGPSGNDAAGIWECPDLVPLGCHGRRVWMLSVSMAAKREEGGNMTQYFLGKFDGDAFSCTIPFGHPERMDEGYDDYAGVTFTQTPVPIRIGWGLCWDYAGDTPTGEYCGVMTLPRVLTLRDTPEGPRLSSAPAVEDTFGDAEPLGDGGLLSEETFRLTVRGEGPCSLAFLNREGQKLLLGVDEKNRLFADRLKAGAQDFNQNYALPLYGSRAKERFFQGPYTMDIIFDVSMLEIFIDGGTRNICMAVYPDSPYRIFHVTGKAEAEIRSLRKVAAET